MSLKGKVTVDEQQIIEVTQDPRTDGADATLGSLALNLASPYLPLLKTGTALTAWTPLFSLNEYYSVTATASVSAASSVYTAITGMTLTPPAGTYFCLLNAGTVVGGATGSGNIALFKAAAQSVISTQAVACTLTLSGSTTITAFSISGSIDCVDILTFTGTETLTAQFKVNSGTLSVNDRTLYLLRLA